MDISIDKLNEILEQLSGLRIREARILKQRLEKEKQKLVPKTKSTIPKESLEIVNLKRSSKLANYWRYIKLIRDNYPHLKTSEIRKQLALRQQGQKTDIPDVVWQNPSG